MPLTTNFVQPQVGNEWSATPSCRPYRKVSRFLCASTRSCLYLADALQATVTDLD